MSRPIVLPSLPDSPFAPAGPRDGLFWRAQMEAYARLIAAAPELLEACESALSTGVLEHGGVADILRAAIAKAKGETPWET